MHSTSPQVDYSKKWTIMAAVAMGIFLATIDGSIVNIALPTLQTDLHASFGLVQWVVLSYLLTVTILMLSIGRWADMVGKKRIYLAGFVIFTIGSLACGLSVNIWMLIAARVFQAIGASMMMALGTAIITENFPPNERGKALGIGGLMVSIGIIAGPSLGGIILGKLTWHWIFFVNLPIGVAGTWMVMRFVPNVIPGKRQRFDFWGAGLLLVSLSCFLIGLTMGESVGYGSFPVIMLLLGFALSLATFLIVESRVEFPMIDLGMFRNALFSVNLVTGFITFIGLAGSTLLMPFYLENVRGYTPQVIGLMLAVVPIMLGITAPISGILSDKVGTRPLTVIGLAMLIVGYATVATLQVDTSIAGYMVRYIPIGLGMGIFQSPNNNAIMSSVPRERFGVASGLLSLTRTLGQITGIATLGAIWTSYVLNTGAVMGEGVLSASPADQVAALQGTMHVVMFAMIFAFVLSLTAWGVEHRRKAYSQASDALAEK